MTFWHDHHRNVAMRYAYNASGQLIQVQGWDNYASESNKGTQTTHLEYQWHNGKLTAMLDHVSGEHQYYTYHSNGLRKTWDDGGTVRTYTYNAEGTLNTRTESWQAKYDGNDSDSRSVTVNSHDVTGRLTKTDIRSYEGRDGKQTSHIWDDITESRAGLKLRETLNGDSTKKSNTKTTTTSFSYDANGHMTSFGKSEDTNGQTETGNFQYNNDGQIVFRRIDPADKDLKTHQRNYFYANGNAVGDKGTDDKGHNVVNLGTESYNPVKNLGDDFPSSALSSFTATGGETLRQVAASLLGNANLWFILAEANGLSGSDSLKAGQTITIPNSVESGKIDSETHKLYNESEIIGSTMPNVRQKAKKKKCASFFMIIVAVVVVAVATFLLPGLGTALATTLFSGLGAAATVAGYALAGAILFAGAEVVRQGVGIALGLQEGFDWKAVGKQAIVGALTGAAGGFGKAAETASSLAKIQSVAKIAQPALKAAAAAVQAMDENGHITNWSGVALAAIGASELTGKGALSTSLNFIKENSNYISPWLNLAETAIRNDGKLTAGDWVGAIGGTITAVIDSHVGTTTNQQGQTVTSYTLDAIVNRSALKTITAGALSLIDEDAAYSYFENAVGSEVGNFIGGGITKAIGNSDWYQNWNNQVQTKLLQQRAADQARFYQSNPDAFKTDQQQLLGQMLNVMSQRADAGKFAPLMEQYQKGELTMEMLMMDLGENINGVTAQNLAIVNQTLIDQGQQDDRPAATAIGAGIEEMFETLYNRAGIDFKGDEGGYSARDFVQNVIDSGKGFSLFLQDSKTGKFSGLYASNQAFKDTIDINFSAERLAADYETAGGALEFQTLAGLNLQSLDAIQAQLMADPTISEHLNNLSDEERQAFVQSWADIQNLPTIDTLHLYPASYGTITPMSDMEAFFTFNKAGQFIKGLSEAPGNIANGLGTLAVETGLTVSDAVGESYTAASNLVTGENAEYQSDSWVGQSIETNGVLLTGGKIIGGTVHGALSPLKAFVDGDYEALGSSAGEFAVGFGVSKALGRLGSAAGRAADDVPVVTDSTTPTLYKVESGGIRGEVPLSIEQRAQVESYLSNFDLKDVDIRWVDDRNLNTAYGDMFGQQILNIGSDVVPGDVGIGTLTANSRISIKGTLAHEIVGHQEALVAGKTQDLLHLEEAQASIRAARFAPDLTSTERVTLLRDAITRLQKAPDGPVKIRDVKDLLYIQNR
ncbi:LysM peptidoglycan-binding domain-containing protein [Gynuella sunshinyii]|uniref:Rhs family protein n=1 Tax=Gynuella sunshinyii YC6258 TaxID=1445510 RepID=A0A0C5UZF7_9GAMM|nr:LysM peptidoglycan-binding domain-containing protein [Gynuella sunshinyii]AJQ92695.1 rhs family protein [Gynuella sunshinyii YC6258]